MAGQIAEEPEPGKATWRFKLGVFLICLVGAAWLFVPILAWMQASAATIATATGIIFIWNKAVILLAVAVMGKPGFQQLKSAIFGVFRFPPESAISPARYNFGLFMFLLPLVTAVLEPYIDAAWPSLRPKLLQLQVAGDLMFLASFIVLGENFWDKFRALFVRTARVTGTTDFAKRLN